MDTEDLIAAIAALEGQRATLGDVVVELAAAPLRARLAELQRQAPVGQSPASGSAPDGQPPASEPRRQLRQVSVLFLDIVGSTGLVQQLDPEEVQSVVDGALTAFTAIVSQHGGQVLSYAGDNLKAAFGAVVAREDDAERAVDCGLALLREAARRGEAVRQSLGIAGFNARVGIHTGAVVRGGGVEQDNSLTGLAVYIAARMEQTAPPGALRITVDTYRQVQGRFDVVEQPLLRFKGLSEPMRSFLVQGTRERRLRGLRHGADGVTTVMVGRRDELQQLLQTAHTLFTPGAALSGALVLGEAGLGKSRLLAEFQAGLLSTAGAIAVWRASSHMQGLHQPYGLLRDLLFWHLGVRDSDSQLQAQQTFASALAPVFGADAEEHTALLGQLVGLDFSASPFIKGILRDGKQLQARGLNAWVRYLRLETRAQPLVLVLDDLQWADDGSLDALDYLVAMAPDAPLMLLCAARPEFLQRRPEWGRAWPRHGRLTLSPLGDTGGEALAAALLGRFAQPQPALQALLSQQAAGNPYYMEALLQMLADTGVIDTAAEHWQLHAERLSGLAVPTTLVGVLQVTLDALSAAERRSLQQASVVGALFWDDALAAIDPLATEQLPALTQRELALPHTQSGFDGAREFGFRHHLLHQVTYNTVLKPDKRQAHAQAARWLQAQSRGRESELASQIAEHFERAGDSQQAVAYWLRAAEDASQRQADASALAHADRALALDDGSDARRLLRAHRVRAQVCMRAGRSAEHGEAAAQIEALVARLDDDVLRLAVAVDVVWPLVLSARFEEAVALGEQRLALAEEQAPAEAGRLHNVLFIALSRLGRRDEALAHALKALAQARKAGDLNTEAAVENNLGIDHLDGQQLSEALARFERAAELYRAAGSRNGVVNVKLNVALAKETLGYMASARDLLLWLLQESREIGGRRFEAIALGNLGSVLCELGEFQQGLDTALAGLRVSRDSGDHRALAFSHRSARTAAHALGRWNEALEHARAAQAGFVSHGHQTHAWMEACMGARLLHALGQNEQALAEADALLAECKAQGGWADAFELPFNLYLVLRALGDERAQTLLEDAHQILVAQAARFADLVPPDVYMNATVAARGVVQAMAARSEGSPRA